jgi:hypothetical protein
MGLRVMDNQFYKTCFSIQISVELCKKYDMIWYAFCFYILLHSQMSFWQIVKGDAEGVWRYQVKTFDFNILSGT